MGTPDCQRRYTARCAAALVKISTRETRPLINYTNLTRHLVQTQKVTEVHTVITAALQKAYEYAYIFQAQTTSTQIPR